MPDHSGMTPLHLRKDGTWEEDGEPVTHARLSALLHRSIALGPNGELVVTTGRDVRPFTCEDTPLRVLTVSVERDAIVMHLSNEKQLPLDPKTLVVDGDDSWRCRVPPGLDARFTRSAQSLLADHVEETSNGFMLHVGQSTHPLRPAP